jgi:hypothetical protein
MWCRYRASYHGGKVGGEKMREVTFTLAAPSEIGARMNPRRASDLEGT